MAWRFQPFTISRTNRIFHAIDFVGLFSFYPIGSEQNAYCVSIVLNSSSIVDRDIILCRQMIIRGIT